MVSVENFAIALWVVGLFAFGAWGGWALRNRKSILSVVGKLTTGLVLVLLFLLGYSVGNNPIVFDNLDVIGVGALLIAIAAIAGSVAFIWIYDRYVLKFVNHNNSKSASGRGNASLGSSWGSVLLLVVFALGVVLGYQQWCASWLAVLPLSTYTLYLFMFFIGIGVGADESAWLLVKRAGIKLFFMPIVILVGSLVGVWLLGLVFNTYGTHNLLPVAAGMGYYSLSSVLISEIRGEQLGALALMANIFREVLTLVFVPVLHRYFGPLSGIASAGATAMDTSLPIIVGCSGKDMVPIAIFNGLILTSLVPIVVTLLLVFGS
jgi:uncharacterized membrane protein YbjE (DUF340 family)